MDEDLAALVKDDTREKMGKAIDHVRHVAPLAKELHHLFARPRQLRPPGFCLGILFQTANLLSLEHEIHLPQSALGSAPNR